MFLLAKRSDLTAAGCADSSFSGTSLCLDQPLFEVPPLSETTRAQNSGEQHCIGCGS